MKTEDIRRSVVDVIFHLWWYPIMGQPAQYGLAKGCRVEPEFLNNVYTIIKVLNAVFYQKPLEENSSFPSCVNDFILKKSYRFLCYLQPPTHRPLVDAYLDQLLAITIPKEVDQADTEDEEVSIVATIICMSLEGIRFLCMVSISYLEYFNPMNSSFAKYVMRIKDFLTTESGFKILEPKPLLFKPIYAKSAGTGGSFHYVIFQDSSLNQKNAPSVTSETWQKILCDLLAELSLNQYYKMSVCQRKESTSSESVISDIIKKVREFPEIFQVPGSKMNRVKLLAKFISNFISKGGEITNAHITEIAEAYSRDMFDKESKESVAQQNMCNMINTVHAYSRRIRDVNNQLELEIIPAFLAAKIIDSKNRFPFFIEKLEIGDTSLTTKKQQPSPGFISFIIPKKSYY